MTDFMQRLLRPFSLYYIETILQYQKLTLNLSIDRKYSQTPEWDYLNFHKFDFKNRRLDTERRNATPL